VPVTTICTSAQIPRRTFYNWWSRYRQHGVEGLDSRPRTPHTIHGTPPQLVEKILRLRQEKGWCPILIEEYLRRVESIEIGHATIHRLLKQAGLNNPLQTPRRQRSYRRWQRKHPNSLWQCDLKVVDTRWLITILDDHSKPTTLGKIERWFRTYDLEHARFQLHRKFVEYYNYERPHMALDYSTPAQVYFRDVQDVLG
jgi:transposase InsO family protein